MSDQQLRLLRWLSNVFALLSDPQLRKSLDGVQMEVICTYAKTNIDATLALEDSNWIPDMALDLDVAELERMLGLE